MDNQYDVVIIGQGYSGLTAAELAASKGLRCVSIEALYPGGLVSNINELDPAPEGTESSAAEFSRKLAAKNMENGVENVSSKVVFIERGGDLWYVEAESGTYVARNVVVATGAHLRKLGVPGEKEFFGQGVSECADCDGPLFRGMEVIVVGGGDSAFQEALALTHFVSKVTIVMRDDAPHARTDLVDRVAENPKIDKIFRAQVTRVEGSAGNGVERVHLTVQGEGEKILSTSGVFAYIGLQPNTEFLPGEVELDDVGAVVTSDTYETALPGLWAIGAVRSGYNGMLSDAQNEAARVVDALMQGQA